MIRMGTYDPAGSCRASSDPVRVDQLGTVEYRTAWDIQREHAAARRDGTGPDVLMLLEHPPVYTAGKRTRPSDRPDRRHPGRRRRPRRHDHLARPGPARRLPHRRAATPLDVVDYVRRLEEALIAVVADLGIDGAGRVDGRSRRLAAADDAAPGAQGRRHRGPRAARA